MIKQTEQLGQRLDVALPAITARDRRYRGIQPLRFASDDIQGDLKYFSINVCRLAVDAVAERMRVKRIEVAARGRDLSELATESWVRNNMDQLLQPLLVDALALGSAYIIVWQTDGRVTITPESAMNVTVDRHPVTGHVTSALKRWNVLDGAGAVASEHRVSYGPNEVVSYERKSGGVWRETSRIKHALGVVPVVPLVNVSRIGDTAGHSVIDDLGHLVDALSKVTADMLVASEDVARPRRWASGVDLEESHAPDDDGFTADAPDTPAPAPAVSPFESGNRMFTVESPDAKFGQLPGADLAGYRTAVDLLMQQIMAVSALPAHMMGVTTANPSSADAIRAAEASLTARAESRIQVLGISLERAVSLMVSITTGYPVDEITTRLHWASAATRSTAQEADAVTKLHSLGIVNTDEAREIIGVETL